MIARFCLVSCAVALALSCLLGPGVGAQGTGIPRVELQAAVAILRLPGEVDSNSPAIWERVAGQNVLSVVTSVNGLPSVASGRSLTQLGQPTSSTFDPVPPGGMWMESVIPDVDGTWYGYYHNEIPANICRGTDKVAPRIAAARSTDRGRTWEPIGVVLEAPPRTWDCTTSNEYFVGGVGDFSVVLDRDSRDLYFFLSTYPRDPSQQGVGVARLAWADRDAPTGKVAVWQGSFWVPSATVGGGRIRWTYPAADPIFPVSKSWHDDDGKVDAFWGPSVHWNTYLSQYVMLLNRARDGSFDQEGVYVAFSPSLESPYFWSTPSKILNGGQWYPQVIGTEDGLGTDARAGETARLFVMGTSRFIIRFIR